MADYLPGHVVESAVYSCLQLHADTKKARDGARGPGDLGLRGPERSVDIEPSSPGLGSKIKRSDALCITPQTVDKTLLVSTPEAFFLFWVQKVCT